MIKKTNNSFLLDGQPLPSKETSQRVEAYYKAKLVQLTYEETTQKIVPMRLVEDMLSSIYSTLHMRIKQTADRLAPRLAQETDENIVYQILLEDSNTTILESAKLLDTKEFKKEIKKESSENPMLQSNKVTKAFRAPLEEL